jgi:hypothetical protein
MHSRGVFEFMKDPANSAAEQDDKLYGHVAQHNFRRLATHCRRKNVLIPHKAVVQDQVTT